MTQTSANSKFVSVKIDRERFEQLKEIAAEQDRPMSSLLRRFIDKGLHEERQAA